MRGRLLWLVGIAIGLIVLIGGLLLFVGAGRSSRIVTSLSPEELTSIAEPAITPAAEPPRSTPQPTAAPVGAPSPPPSPVAAAPPTAAPALAPTPVPAVIIPTPQPEVPVFYDDFAGLGAGWAPFDVDKRGNFNGYAGGHYLFHLTDSTQLRYDVLPGKSFGPGRYAFDLRYEQGNGTFGLMLGIQGDPQQFDSLSFYRLDLTPQGDSAFTPQRVGGVAQPVAGASQRVPITPGRTTHVELLIGVDSMQMLIDNTPALSVGGIRFSEGGIGLIANSGDQPLRVMFDNLLFLGNAQADAPACATIRTLQLQPVGLSVGGGDVQVVQERLHRLGYGAGMIGGLYTDETAGAVQQFQERNRLVTDGNVGPETWCRLVSSDAVREDGESEALAEEKRFAVVPLTFPFRQPAPLFVSIRQPDQSWRVGIILPGQSVAQYLETGADALEPAFSPNGRYLAFTSDRSGSTALWLLDTRTGELSQISQQGLTSEFPSWSPDSRFILYTGEPEGGSRLSARNYVFDMTTRQTRLFADEHTGWSRWSSQNELLFTRWNGNNFDLFRANPDGSGVTNLTNTDTVNEDIAAWSPDGTMIAFVASPPDELTGRQIFVMSREGTGLRLVAALQGPSSNPVWSPDGQAIVFVNQPPGAEWQLWLAGHAGEPPYQLSTNQERVWFLNWPTLQ